MDDVSEDGGECGIRVPRKMPDPKVPTLAEVEEHNMTHLPYRSWCTHCVRGRGESHPHRRIGEEDRSIPELHMDYCFMGKADEKTQPVLVMKDRDTGMMCSMLVKEKGAADEYVIKRIIAFIKELGYESAKLVLKSDQESSVKAVIDKVTKARGDAPTLPEHSPVRSSGSNGVIERGIKEVQGQLRAMKSALDTRLTSDIRGTSNILPWMVEYASVLINRYLVGKDGKTAHERLRGKASRMLGFEFGEVVHFRRIPVQGRLGKLDSLWQKGLFIGYKTQSGEYMVANDEAAYKSRTLKRLPEEERWDKRGIEDLPWTPWKVRKSDGGGRETDRADHDPFLDIDVDKSVNIPLPPQVADDAMPRRVYITRATLTRYGMTEGCMGCVTSAIGGTGVAHSEDCRRRIEKEMRQDPEQRERIREAKIKRKDFIEKHAKRARITPDAEDEQADEKMSGGGNMEDAYNGIPKDAYNGIPSTKRKAEKNPGTEDMEIMYCMCESHGEVNIVSEDRSGLDEYKQDGCMEELPQSWADATEEETRQREREPEERETFYDNLTGKALKYENVIEARWDEIKALQEMGVWKVVPLSECVSRTQRRPIRGRWVDVNKGDDVVEVYRSRYVAMELKRQHGGASREGLFAAMPPLEGMRLLLSFVASRRGCDVHYKLMFLDISKAYLHAEVLDDNIFVELPPEMKQPDMCGHLRRALYGTRQAARAWEEEYSRTLQEAGFQRGQCNPCMFYNVERDIRVLVHGDDFTAAGSDEGLKYVAATFQNKYKTKVRGTLGPDPPDMKAITILNRIVGWTAEGIRYEADPRHVDLIIEELGLQKANGSSITGCKIDEVEGDTELDSEEAYRYRSVAARLNFLAADRVDIQFASKEICRSMSAPRASDWGKVRKLGRYLNKFPRQVLWFRWQEPQTTLNAFVDTDYAACPRTRRSTNGGLVMHGEHLVKSWASTQTVVALSSGEAEYYGVAKGACEAIGIKGLASDMGVRLSITMCTDSSAAKGIATRKGLGKVKHLETRTLWVQDKVDQGIIKIRKVDGNHNVADLLTKYLSGPKLQTLLAMLPVAPLEGRHHLAPQLQGGGA